MLFVVITITYFVKILFIHGKGGQGHEHVKLLRETKKKLIVISVLITMLLFFSNAEAKERCR